MVDSEALTATVDECGWEKMSGKLSRSGNSSVEWYLKCAMISAAQVLKVHAPAMRHARSNQ